MIILCLTKFKDEIVQKLFLGVSDNCFFCFSKLAMDNFVND